MSPVRFALFTAGSDHLRPFIIKASVAVFGTLLLISVFEMAVLVLGAHGLSLPLFLIDIVPKTRELALKVMHELR
jgi:hypothetical protein